MQITERIPLSNLLRIRPAVIGLLNASGLDFWGHVELPLDLFCHRFGLKVEMWLNQIENLPVPSEKSDWSHEPLYRVVDFLTAEHREFRGELHHIHQLLETYGIPIYPDSIWLQHVRKALEPFQKMFVAHMREEEEKIFPHILRLEAFTCDPNAQSLLSEVALERFATEQLSIAEDNLKKTVSDIMTKIHEHRVEEPTLEIAHGIRMELERFEKRLNRHNDIETRFLFSRALKMEKQFARFLKTAHPEKEQA